MTIDRKIRRVARPLVCAVLSISAMLVFDLPAFAQDGASAVGPPAFEFSFSNPGARAMGFGGAFTAMADDATAAFANPAGLVQLIEPEISLELRSWNYSTPYTAGGRYEGAPSQIGIDTLAGLRTGESAATLHAPSFLSYVHPGPRWSFALYRHQLARFASNTATNGLFGGGSSCCQKRALDVVERIDLDIVSYGVAAARRLTDRISFGVGVQYHRSALAISTRMFRPADDSIASFFAPNPFRTDREVMALEYHLTDSTSFGITAGMMWKGPRWRFGGVYRRGPRVTLSGVGTAGPANLSGLSAGSIIGRTDVEIEFPDVFAIGSAFQTSDGSLTIGVEWDRVGYSSILESIGGAPEIEVGSLSLEDADEIHLGCEYVFLRSDPLVAVRAGLWRDPNHRVRYFGSNAFDAAILPSRKDNLHVAIGFGLAFERVQVDVGADFSDIVNTMSVSLIRTF